MALATGAFFWNIWGKAVLFLTIMTTYLLLFYHSVYAFWMVRPWGRVPSSVCSAWVKTLMHSPCISLFHFHGDNLVAFLMKMTLLYPSGAAPSKVWSSNTVAAAWCMDNRCTTLAFTHGIAKASISLSFMTFMMQLIVGVPKIMGSHSTNFDSSGMTRAIWSSS